MRLKVSGYTKARKRWAHYRDAYQPNAPIFKKAGEIISRSVSKNFEAQGRPKWPKRKHVYDWPILWKTGAMRARAERTALTWTHQGRHHIDQITSRFYGIFHQYGTKKLPVRKFVVFVEAEREKLRALHRKVFRRKL